MKMRIGIDVDGVLADFNSAYIEKCIEVTGKDLFPPRPFDIVTWSYPESYGYKADEVSAVWADIKASPTFWADLTPYPEVPRFRAALAKVLSNGHDVYFVTSRPGNTAKAQTEAWLWNHLAMIEWPTVLISSYKGECAHALALTDYIDDRTENVADVVAQHPATRCFMLDQPWNQAVKGAPVLHSLDHFSEYLEEMA